MNIIYNSDILYNLTSYTNYFSGSSSAITSDNYINSGFTLSIKSFDNNSINRIDIINNIINYIDGDINKYQLNILIVDNSKIYTNVTQIGTYCVKISYNNEIEDYLIMNIINILTTTTTTTIRLTTSTTTTNNIIKIVPPIIVKNEDINIVFNPNILTILTGNTSDFLICSGITPNIYIESGFTLSLIYFDDNIINKIDIINYIINYIDGDISKYQLDVFIVDSEYEYNNITKSGNYCVKLSYYDNTIIYLIMKVVSYYLTTTTTTTTKSITTTTTTTLNPFSPIIYYNYPISGTTWIGGGEITPYNVYLHLVNNGITGWTLDSLKILFIDKVIECFEENISLNNITFNLYEEGSNIKIYEIDKYGIYYIYISVIDSIGNRSSSYIYNIIVNDSSPKIIFDYNILSESLTGNTSDFSIATGITSGIYIGSGFTLNLNDFDRNIITDVDIIDNVIYYTKDYTDFNINKYNSNILIVGSKFVVYNNIIYTEINKPGYYCIKISLKNNIENEIIYYVMLFVIYDISSYSEGYWQDNKVWIDSTKWLDYPIVPKNS